MSDVNGKYLKDENGNIFSPIKRYVITRSLSL